MCGIGGVEERERSRNAEHRRPAERVLGYRLLPPPPPCYLCTSLLPTAPPHCPSTSLLLLTPIACLLSPVFYCLPLYLPAIAYYLPTHGRSCIIPQPSSYRSRQTRSYVPIEGIDPLIPLGIARQSQPLISGRGWCVPNRTRGIHWNKYLHVPCRRNEPLPHNPSPRSTESSQRI